MSAVRINLLRLVQGIKRLLRPAKDIKYKAGIRPEIEEVSAASYGYSAGSGRRELNGLAVDLQTVDQRLGLRLAPEKNRRHLVQIHRTPALRIAELSYFWKIFKSADAAYG